MSINRNHVRKIFELLRKHNPSPKTDLKFSNNYTLLVAVLLSAQTTDKSVNSATKDLFKLADTPEKMLALGVDKLKNLIKTIGLYNNKSENIIKLSRMLVDEYDSNIPQNESELINLPGIGRKSANVIVNTLYGIDAIAVDTHVFRLSKRLGLSDSKTPEKVERDLINIIPTEFHNNASNWLVLHGRYVCTARKPKCSQCFLSELCPYYRQVEEQIDSVKS